MRQISLLAVSVSAEVFFKELFDAGWEKRWIHSNWKHGEGSQGTFTTSPGMFYSDEVADAGLYTPEPARFYSSSAHFDTFSNAGRDLVIQYELKHEVDLECGGSYFKIGPKMEDPTMFGDPTPYNIMFGPDQCGGTKRIHLIFTDKAGKNHLRKVDMNWHPQELGVSHLLALHIKPDNTYKVYVDLDEKWSGSLLEDFGMIPDKKIPDPSDVKPSDWVDEAQIDDPDAVKPDDWVDVKKIVDPEAKKPEDWDDEEDGDWEAPTIDNPAYKGEWKAPKIANPAYKGKWVQAMIDNPDYPSEEKTKDLYAYEHGFIGFDLWQVKAKTIFRNILITDSLEEAEKFARDTWSPRREVEEDLRIKANIKEKEERMKKMEEEEAAKKSGGDDDDDDDDFTDERTEVPEKDIDEEM